MNKRNIENVAKALPAFFKNAVEYLKGNFQDNGQKVLEKSGGTIGVIISLFAQPLIDKYFENLSKKKLDNFGLNVYLKAALIQASESVEQIKDKLDNSLEPTLVFNILSNTISNEIKEFSTDDILLIFQPKYHPAVVYVKKNYQGILRDINTNSNDIKIFLKHFNDNIEATVIKEFGDDYEKHLEEVDAFRLKENETNILWDTVSLGKIGFKESENLKYETTYAQWKKISMLREKDSENITEEDNIEQEKKLKPIESLIEEYFNLNPSNHIDKILFVIADFGKGKSIFMKYFAAKLAKKYLQTSDGYFPVYFNLRDFKNYSSEPRLGIISDYLESKYSIKIDDEYFQNKKYIFLIDSLDESGELNKRAIDKVITSVKNIQGIDKTKFKTNRIIITSRPFDDGLNHNLNEHNPYVVKNNENRDVSYFINIYGFTKFQFNDWLIETLKQYSDLDKIDAKGFAKEIIDSIKINKKIDIYERLLKNGTLSRSELRRPIFAYMIYQLIINNVDFLSIGKLGVYLSFLNLLTKEAKHIHDINYKVNLIEEFEFRNILHATASLWMYERQKGKQGMLMKADICRVLEGKNNSETDNEILDRFKGQGFTEIQFLSHSYFGEDNNVLHFQHQSFAEILLAEYYLKVFIKYALDEDSDVEEARIKLILGEPTEQTLSFFKEMLRLLRDTVVNSNSDDIIEKRKLLFPLMASLATKKHNRLFCNNIFYSWYSICEISENQTEYPKKSLENWCIDEKKLKRIISLSSIILNSKINYLPTQANPKSALFNLEVIEIQNQSLSSLPQYIDKWIALIVGNILYNDIKKDLNIFFNTDYNIAPNNLFEMIKSWNYTFNDSCPYWGKDLFRGINMDKNNNQIDLSHYDFDGIDFSYSYFRNIHSWGANWSRTILNNCSFNSIEIITSFFYGTSINNIQGIQQFYMGNCIIGENLKLLDCFNTKDLETHSDFLNKNKRNSHIHPYDLQMEDTDIFNTLSGFIKYGLENKLFTFNKLKAFFSFETEETKTDFYNRLNEYKKYELKKKK